MAADALSKVKKAVEDLGSEISSGEDALRLVGRLDVVASAILEYSFPKRKISRAPLLPEVLRRAAAKARVKAQAKLLRRGARKAEILAAIAGEVSYGELDERGVNRAEEARSELYDFLYEFIEGLTDDE